MDHLLFLKGLKFIHWENQSEKSKACCPEYEENVHLASDLEQTGTQSWKFIVMSHFTKICCPKGDLKIKIK